MSILSNTKTSKINSFEERHCFQEALFLAASGSGFLLRRPSLGSAYLSVVQVVRLLIINPEYLADSKGIFHRKKT